MIDPNKQYGNYLFVDGHNHDAEALKIINECRKEQIRENLEGKEKLFEISMFSKTAWIDKDDIVIHDEEIGKEFGLKPITFFCWKTKK